MTQKGYRAKWAGVDVKTLKAAKNRVISADDDALWLWGTLKDFERLKILSSTFDDIFAKAPEHIRKDLSRLAPLVAEWLCRTGQKDAVQSAADRAEARAQLRGGSSS